MEKQKVFIPVDKNSKKDSAWRTFFDGTSLCCAKEEVGYFFTPEQL